MLAQELGAAHGRDSRAGPGRPGLSQLRHRQPGSGLCARHRHGRGRRPDVTAGAGDRARPARPRSRRLRSGRSVTTVRSLWPNRHPGRQSAVRNALCAAGGAVSLSYAGKPQVICKVEEFKFDLKGAYSSPGDQRPSRRGRFPKRPIKPKTAIAIKTKVTATAAITGVYPYRSELKILIGNVSTVNPATM